MLEVAIYGLAGTIIVACTSLLWREPQHKEEGHEGKELQCYSGYITI